MNSSITVRTILKGFIYESRLFRGVFVGRGSWCQGVHDTVHCRKQGRSRGLGSQCGSSLGREPIFRNLVGPTTVFHQIVTQHRAHRWSNTMCGIFFSLGSKDFVQPEKDTQLLIKKRGPDSYRAIQVRFQQHGPAGDTECATYLTFISSVLALRGDHTEAQPFIDSKTQSVLCWNGEAWKISGETVTGNDTHHVFQLFLESVKPSGNFDLLGKVTEHSSLAALTQAISRISGPFSFVFYDSLNSRVIYGRDSLGRRSLLSGWDGEGSFKISSVCDGISSSCFEEVSTDGIHVINLSRAFGIGGGPQNPETIPWIHGKSSLAAYLVRLRLRAYGLNLHALIGSTYPTHEYGAPRRRSSVSPYH